jgi:hypothetical protein
MLLLLLLIAVALLIMRSGSRDSMFGFSGHKNTVDVKLDSPDPDLNGFSLDSRPITPDEVQSCVVPAQRFFEAETGLCVYPLDTSSFRRYVKDGKSVYRFRIMFTVTSQGFPYAVGATFYVSDGAVLGARTQQMTGKTFTPYEESMGEFTQFNDIVADQRKVILSQQ